MFENKKYKVLVRTYEDGTEYWDEVHASRIIASWSKMNGLDSQSAKQGFANWMRYVLKLSEADRTQIMLFAVNGKLELETSAQRYFREANTVKPNTAKPNTVQPNSAHLNTIR